MPRGQGALLVGDFVRWRRRSGRAVGARQAVPAVAHRPGLPACEAGGDRGRGDQDASPDDELAASHSGFRTAWGPQRRAGEPMRLGAFIGPGLEVRPGALLRRAGAGGHRGAVAVRSATGATAPAGGAPSVDANSRAMTDCHLRRAGASRW